MTQVADENHLRVLNSLIFKVDDPKYLVGIPNWRGDYLSSIAYSRGDIVRYNGSLYIATHEFNDVSETGVFKENATAGILPTDTDKWDLLIATSRNLIENIPITQSQFESGSDSDSSSGNDSGNDNITFTNRQLTLYRGSTLMGIPTSVKVIVEVTKGSKGAVRIFDQTNNKVICEITNLSGKDCHEEDMGKISNVPSSSAIWEIQNSGNAVVHNVNILY